MSCPPGLRSANGLLPVIWLVLLVWSSSGLAAYQALLFGNGAYDDLHGMPSLTNACSDARAVAQVLEELDFRSTVACDLYKDQNAGTFPEIFG